MADTDPGERNCDNMLKMLSDLNKDLEKILEEMEKISERRRERERNIIGHLLHAPHTTTDQESNQQPLGAWVNALPLSHNSPDVMRTFKIYSLSNF
uniref:Synaptonemal complex central element protein 3 n=1 Tax=Molossus molossus TaxID=27622 RepID=A0A7J8BKQ4_MOLMO|nr:synaptonemal complex central element protein 3 [Molossus molossus]